MKYAVLLLLLSASGVHVTVYDNAHIESCQVTHKATLTENWIGLTCEYTCHHPVVESIDAKDGKQHDLCREGEPK